MNDNRLACTVQPLSYRANPNVPQWVHFPKLKLLLGWGPGLWETLGPRFAGLRTVVIPENTDTAKPSLAWLMNWFYEHYQFSDAHRAHAPHLTIISAGTALHELRMDGIGLHKVPMEPTSSSVITIENARDYGVRAVFTDGETELFVVRRARKLKLKYQERMKKFRLTYQPGTGKRNANPGGKRTEDEQRFSVFLAEIKNEYVEKRVRELLASPTIRPVDFAARCSAIGRSRMGEVWRGKHDSDDKRKRPLKEEELTERACKEIARHEASDQCFDFAWVPERALSKEAFIEISSAI